MFVLSPLLWQNSKQQQSQESGSTSIYVYSKHNWLECKWITVYISVCWNNIVMKQKATLIWIMCNNFDGCLLVSWMWITKLLKKVKKIKDIANIKWYVKWSNKFIDNFDQILHNSAIWEQTVKWIINNQLTRCTIKCFFIEK